MGKQYNKEQKATRRKAYLKRKNAASKAKRSSATEKTAAKG